MTCSLGATKKRTAHATTARFTVPHPRKRAFAVTSGPQSVRKLSSVRWYSSGIASSAPSIRSMTGSAYLSIA